MNWNWNWTPSLIHFVCTIRTVTLLKLLLSFSNKKKLEPEIVQTNYMDCSSELSVEEYI